MRLIKMLLMVTSCMLIGGFAAAAATPWPTKPVTIVVGYSPGGMSDLATRIVADKLQSLLGQPVIIQNKPGAGGMLGMQNVANAKPDGYTAYGGSITQPLAMQFFSDSVNLALKDFKVAGGFLPHERVLFIQPDAPYSTWEEFISYVKANPNAVSIGFGGGMWSLEVMRYIAAKEGLQWKLVAYKSGSEASADFFGKHIDIAEAGVGTAVYQGAFENRSKILINVSGDKVPGFEDTPRLMDKGYNFPVLSEYGFLFPLNTPQEIVDKMTDALQKAMTDEPTLEKLRKMGARPRFLAPEAFTTTADKALKAVPELIEANKAFTQKQ